jgi:hypothetical protein
MNAPDVLERARSIGVWSNWVLLVQKEAKTNEPISRAYERAKNGVGCGSNVHIKHTNAPSCSERARSIGMGSD